MTPRYARAQPTAMHSARGTEARVMLVRRNPTISSNTLSSWPITVLA